MNKEHHSSSPYHNSMKSVIIFHIEYQPLSFFYGHQSYWVKDLVYPFAIMITEKPFDFMDISILKDSVVHY